MAAVTEVTFSVPTAASYWGDVTDDEARECAQRHAAAMENWLKAEFPSAKVTVRLFHTDGRGYADQTQVYADEGGAVEGTLTDAINDHSCATWQEALAPLL